MSQEQNEVYSEIEQEIETEKYCDNLEKTSVCLTVIGVQTQSNHMQVYSETSTQGAYSQPG